MGGGCFWCIEAVFQMIRGVESVVSGYAGGKTQNPTYEEVCTGMSGHAEVIQVTFDPSEVSLDTLLDFFWMSHDPTQLNRQGADTGTQYRSTLMYTDDSQREAMEASKAAAQPAHGNMIVTEVVPLDVFYNAEVYHQNYFRNSPGNPYCAFNIAPKVRKLSQAIEERGLLAKAS